MSIVKEYVKSNQQNREGGAKELVVDMLDRSLSSDGFHKSTSSEEDLPRLPGKQNQLVSKTEAPVSRLEGHPPGNWRKQRSVSANKQSDGDLQEFTNHEVHNILASRKRMMSTHSHNFNTNDDKVIAYQSRLAWQDSSLKISKNGRVLPKLIHNHMQLTQTPKQGPKYDKELLKIRASNVRQERESLYDDVLNQKMITNDLKQQNKQLRTKLAFVTR